MQLSEHIIQLEAELEKEPSDQQVRSILADAYESIGDPLAETLRWMVARDRRPFSNGYPDNRVVCWNTGKRVIAKSFIPETVLSLMVDGTADYKFYRTVKAATWDLHEALTGGKDGE